MRIGTFTIPTDVVEDEELHAAVKAVMGSVIVVRAEHRYAQKCFEYEALCDAFDDLPEGEIPPRYDAEIDEEDGGSVSWKRVN